MGEVEVKAALRLLQSREREFVKGEILLRTGEITTEMGLVLEGSVTIESNDIWGNRTLLNIVGEGEFFGESYALLKDEPMLVDVRANGSCRVLFLKVGSLLQSCNAENVDAGTFKLLKNLLAVTAHKNLHLSVRSFHTAPKTVRGRIMAYLNMLSLKKRTGEFDIPFNRQQMADYLNLDRSALSKELGKMRDEGIIRFHKNHFIICTFRG
ncbi:MAG: Crp/Fnr family transcriptional regulator [Fretibacterium sp.]|nr:Crp/Fnr family transcriptional regulator [Fretibacterium sp.]